MNQIVVGISDLKVSGNIGDMLITYALGSCIGVAVYDPGVKVGGLLHFMLPDSSIDCNKAQKNPAMFANTGIPLLFKSCYKMGAEKKRMIVKIAGGASIMDDINYFRIGQKNITALRKIFWRNGVIIDGEDIGENHNRTVKLHISTGKILVKNSANVFEEL
ncbi:MAG: chemotaxis protein CheD [Deltaproteobacteria bacterium]|nr:chemotaxis protein CheD [Deltaproteobacteria bacterium]MBW1718859.1 chemotaxis protein CheD [Deltaproteobacteria bacterium]MBW2080981.1 chemotaxis protein CheD [Deltaproteobacteria bacterium]MBW2350735.1 chemotaxis protein CheD [Deltaproteobacteria bacterium]